MGVSMEGREKRREAVYTWRGVFRRREADVRGGNGGLGLGWSVYMRRRCSYVAAMRSAFCPRAHTSFASLSTRTARSTSKSFAPVLGGSRSKMEVETENQSRKNHLLPTRGLESSTREQRTSQSGERREQAGSGERNTRAQGACT